GSAIRYALCARAWFKDSTRHGWHLRGTCGLGGSGTLERDTLGEPTKMSLRPELFPPQGRIHEIDSLASSVGGHASGVPLRLQRKHVGKPQNRSRLQEGGDPGIQR